MTIDFQDLANPAGMADDQRAGEMDRHLLDEISAIMSRRAPHAQAMISALAMEGGPDGKPMSPREMAMMMVCGAVIALRASVRASINPMTGELSDDPAHVSEGIEVELAAALSVAMTNIVAPPDDCDCPNCTARRARHARRKAGKNQG